MTSKRMTVIAMMSLTALAVRPALAQTPSASPLVQQGDELYTQRGDLAKAKEARAKYEAALAAKEDDYGASWRLARVLYWIGDHTTTNDAKKPIFLQGIEHAKKAVELDPNKPDGHFWLGVNYGVYGEAKGVLKSLALVKPIKAAMRRVLELEKGSHKTHKAHMGYRSGEDLSTHISAFSHQARKEHQDLQEGFRKRNSPVPLVPLVAIPAVSRPGDTARSR